MANRLPKPKTAALLILLGCIIVGGIFWIMGGGYRAASPLIFILGLAGSLWCIRGSMPSLLPQRDVSLDRQKKILWRKHVPELIAGLYLNHISKYPDWKDISPESIPQGVTAAVRTPEGHIKAIIYFTEYEFRLGERTFETPDGAARTHGLLEIFSAGKKVFGLLLRKEKADYEERWVPFEIEMLTTGQWLIDMRNLTDEIIAIIKTKARESREA